MTQPVLLIVEETIQRAYKLDADNPDHADLINRVVQAPLEGHEMPYNRHTPAPLFGRRGNKGNRTPFIGVARPEGGMTRLDPDAEHAVNSMMTLLHLDETGKPFHQLKVKRTTVERGPVKS